MTNAIDKIHEFDKFGSRLGMERMNVLLEKIGNPQLDLKVIHVAGTNGKGSVCKYLEEGLASCGYNVGLYTSPFIEKFNERIRLGGQDIPDEDLDIYTERVLSAVKEMVEEGHDSPTEFEVVTSIALLYYKEKKADITILEVGLGGSGDSTNVVPEPMICAITSISYDHMDRLGNTLEEIAADKAGIIKPGVPVISNVDAPGAARVIARKAYECGSRLYDVSKVKFEITEQTPFSQKVSMELYETDYSDVITTMTGKHQGENLKTALAIIEVLRKEGKIKVERSRLYAGLKKAAQPGRFEVLSGDEENPPIVIIDGAHNEAGAAALENTAGTYFADKKVLLITGMLADKQVEEILEHFVNITKDIIITEPDNPRKLSVDKLDGILKNMGISAIKAQDAVQAINTARDVWDKYDAVIFAGSLYLIGDVRRVIKHG